MFDHFALLNTTICTGGQGRYTLQSKTLDEVKNMIEGRASMSFIGHGSTAQIMSELLGFEVVVSRDQFKQEQATPAICFKLKGRPEEGKILSLEEIEGIGYEWFLMTFNPLP